MIRWPFFLLCLFPSPLFAECGKPDPVFEVDGLIPEFYSCHEASSMEYDDILSLTAFNMFSGFASQDAIRTLHSQGFECDENICRKTTENRETNFERWFGKHMRTEPTRGKRYWYRRSYTVAFHSDTIADLGDLSADYKSETALVKVFTRPKPTDFEVVYD